MTNSTQAPRNVIFNGDCIDVTRSFERGTVDFILTDSPYVTNFRDQQGRTVANDDIVCSCEHSVSSNERGRVHH